MLKLIWSDAKTEMKYINIIKDSISQIIDEQQINIYSNNKNIISALAFTIRNQESYLL